MNRIISRYLLNLPGWRTSRRLVVIESDDWGSIRMPSKEIYNKCIKAGYPVDKNAYERFDSLASEDDLEFLFEILTSIVDINGNHPIITANCLVANPDFTKIKTNNFENYHYELITETFKKYPNHTNNFNIWKQGMSSNVFHPQFHGREHININSYMRGLRSGERDILFGFENNMAGSISMNSGFQNHYIDAFNFDSLEEKEEILSILKEGLELFEALFGYPSESLIPINYTWSPDFNQAIRSKGIFYYQGIRRIREPKTEDKYKYHTHYLGERNTNGQIYLVRNVHFEPSLFYTKTENLIDRCLQDMGIAFRMHKPAIISSHRINYVGFLDESNRDRTLKMLPRLLSEALKKWPDIEFITSDQLGRLII